MAPNIDPPGQALDQTVRWCAFDAGSGLFRVAATEGGACRLGVPGEDAGAFFRWLAVRFPRARLVEDPSGLARFVESVRAYFTREAREVPGPLELVGSEFHRAVWLEVLRVPFGTTVSYGEVARRIGAPQSSRSVGVAVASNPLPVFVPTHRVIGSDGRLPGYGPSVSFKEELLRLEGIRLRERGERSPSPAPAIVAAPEVPA